MTDQWAIFTALCAFSILAMIYGHWIGRSTRLADEEEEEDEIVFEVEEGEEEDSPVFVSEGDFMAPSKKYFHDMTGGAVGLSVIGGDVYLLMPDMRMHKLEVTKYAKPSATGDKPATVRSIRKTPEQT